MATFRCDQLGRQIFKNITWLTYLELFVRAFSEISNKNVCIPSKMLGIPQGAWAFDETAKVLCIQTNPAVSPGPTGGQDKPTLYCT